MMFDLEKEIKKWRKSLNKNGILEEGQIAEMESHLLDVMEHSKNEGYSSKEALEQAVKEIGEVFMIQKEFGKSVNKCIESSGSSYAYSLIVHYIKTGLRIFKRNIGFSTINTLGLAFAIAASILSYVIISNELSYDKYNDNAEDIYRIIYDRKTGDSELRSAVSPLPLGPYLKNNFAQVSDFTRYTTAYNKLLLTYEDKSFNEEKGVYADPGFANIFDLKFVEGNTQNILNDKSSIILTQSTARKYFGNESALGKQMLLEGSFELIVRGVIQDPPDNSHLKYNFILPFKLQEQWGLDFDNWENWGYSYTYIMLKPNSNVESFASSIKNIVHDHLSENENTISLQRLDEIHLDNTVAFDGYADIGSMEVIFLLIGITIIVLVSAIINFVNLSSVRVFRRAGEIGMRKALGASRKQVILQMLGETFILILFSTMFALLIAWYVLPYINSLQQTLLKINIFSPEVIFLLGVLVLVLTILAGGYPAILLSSFGSVKAIKGRTNISLKGPLFRKSLSVVQFVLAIFLLTSAAFINEQFDLLTNSQLGISKENIICSQLKADSRNRYEVLKTQIKEIPGVKSVTSAADISPVYHKSLEDVDWIGKDEELSGVVYTGYVDYGYIETFDLKMSSGRPFDDSRLTDKTSSYIINESAAKLIGEDVLGKSISVEGVPGEIIGVVKDYKFMSLYYEIKPLILCIRPNWRNVVFVKVETSGEEQLVVDEISNRWSSLFPNIPFEYTFYDKYLETQYSKEEIQRNLFTVFAILALIISVMGTWGFFSFMAEQKTKEIAIRKVLGSSIFQIIGRITKEYLYMILISVGLSWIVTYYYIDKWLESFAYRVDMNPEVFLVTAVIGIAILLGAISIKALQKAVMNPIESIKSE